MVDIFISYSHHDRDWVTKVLLAGLEDRGFSTLIDFRDFKTGSFGLQEMERGVIESRHTLAVLTPDYVASNWSTLENVMAQSSDPAAIQRRLIPVLRADCKLPLRLSIIHYRDFRDDTKLQWDLLSRDLM